MLSKCANPACSAAFRYLHEGRLYRVDVENGVHPNGPFLVNGYRHGGRIEHFWLCDACAARLTLAFRKDTGVTVVPRELLRAAS